MAKKPSSKDAARLKAQQMRQEQERREKKTRAIIFAAVGSLLAVAIVAVVWVIATSRANQSESIAVAELKPMVVSSKGVGVADPDAPVVREYFDYSCHACANLDVFAGSQLWDAAVAGEITLELVPVDVVKMPWHYAMSHAAYLVSENEPDKLRELHHSSYEFFKQQYDSGSGSVIQNNNAALAKVKELATQAGVSASIVDQINLEGAMPVLQANSTAWREAEVEGRNGLGTPELVANGKAVVYSGNTAEEIVSEIVAAAKGE